VPLFYTPSYMAKKSKSITSKKTAGKPTVRSVSRTTTVKRKSAKRSLSDTKSSLPPKISYREGVPGKDFQLTRLDKQYKGLSIYKIEFDLPDDNRCVNYVDSANNTIVFQNINGEYVLFNLDGTPVSETTKSLCLQKLASKQRTLSKNRPKNESLARGIVLLQDCAPAIDLSGARSVLAKLNAELEEKCGASRPLFMKFAPFHEFDEDVTRFNEYSNLSIAGQFYNTLILALCTSDGKCVSTIEFLLSHSGEIAILSKTVQAEEGKRYNKMLRYVLTMIAMQLPGIHSIKSIAVNPISAWLLIHYFHARVDAGNPFEIFLKDKGIAMENITQPLIQAYYAEKKGPVHLTIDVNDANSQDSYTQFHKLVAGVSPADEIKC
jgi:hypothetical protein